MRGILLDQVTHVWLVADSDPAVPSFRTELARRTPPTGIARIEATLAREW